MASLTNKQTRLLYATVLIVFFLVALITEAMRTVTYCSATAESESGSKVTRNCYTPELKTYYCSVGAFDTIMKGVDDDGNGNKIYTTVKVYCPWSVRTSIANYIAIVAAIIFVILFIRAEKQSSIVSGYIAAGITGISVALMAIDIKDGYLATGKSSGEDDGRYRHDIFLVNIVFSFLAGMILVTIPYMISNDKRFGSTANTGPAISLQVTPSPFQANYNPQMMNSPQSNGFEQSGRSNYSGQPLNGQQQTGYNGQIVYGGQQSYGQPNYNLQPQQIDYNGQIIAGGQPNYNGQPAQY